MRSVLVASALLGLLATGSAAAQSRENIERCRAIDDDQRRLNCYDAIRLPAPPLSKYEVVDFSELREFALSYRGQLVEVAGVIVPAGDFLFLSTPEDRERTMPVDIEQLQRRQRDELVEQCAEGCEAVVRGRVRPVNFTTGIVADAIIPR
jgi:hypothetical protein